MGTTRVNLSSPEPLSSSQLCHEAEERRAALEQAQRGPGLDLRSEAPGLRAAPAGVLALAGKPAARPAARVLGVALPQVPRASRGPLRA